jgi:UDP-glucuronate decarboxylase
VDLLQTDIAEIVDTLGPLGDEFAGKRILIAGGRGFLGRYLSEVFLALNERLDEPCEIVVLDNFITAGVTGSTVQKRRHFAFVNHDITKPFYPERPVHFVIQAAGIASPYYYRKYPLETLEVATVGLKNTLEIAKTHKARLIFFSSSEIYGDPDSRHVPTKESYRGHVGCLGPRACYDESKRLGETLVQIYHQQMGVQGCIIRPFNVYGPGMQKTDYRVLPNFAARYVSGETLQVYGTGKQTRTYCYVVDAIRGFLQVLVNGTAGEPYNIGNPKPELSVLELVQTIERVVGKDLPKIVTEHPDSYPADEPNRRCPDITKAQAHVKYQPKITLDEGLRRFFTWAQEAYKEEIPSA